MSERIEPTLDMPKPEVPQQEPEFWEWAAYDEEKDEWSEWARVQDAGQLYSLKNHVQHGYQYRLRPLFAGPHLKCSQMTFSEALHAVKCGEKIAREGWNGKRQFVIKAGGYTVKESRPGSDYAKHGIGLGEEFTIAPHLDLRNAQGVMQPGWVPSQGDMFAEDWYVICPMVG